MTIDQLARRDARIAALEALGPPRFGGGRSAAQDAELSHLLAARDQRWRRLAGRIADTRRRLAELETYARQAGFTFPEDRHA